MPKIRVLIFPAGEINAIELHDSLASCVNIDLFGASSIDRLGPFCFRNYISGVPLINEPDFPGRFTQLLAEKKIDIVFPTHDTVAEKLASLGKELPALVLGGDAYAASICRDKLKTYELFQNEPFCPVFRDPEADLPRIIKPRRGQGAKGIKMAEAGCKAVYDPALEIVTEFLPGEEYTVDCLTDNSGELRVVCPRSRLRVFGGITMAGKAEADTPAIWAIARAINQKLTFLGLWWFQIKRDRNDNWKLLEICCRYAGSMVLTRARGINLPLLSVYTAMGYEIAIPKESCLPIMETSLKRHFRLGISYSTVYIDFDDTLILNGEVHLPAVWFLYQCRNSGKKIILLTRHEQDINESLRKYALSRELFDEIIVLGWNERKYQQISVRDAILIDNAWQERNEAHEKLNIPVFDVEGLEILMKWDW